MRTFGVGRDSGEEDDRAREGEAGEGHPSDNTSGRGRTGCGSASRVLVVTRYSSRLFRFQFSLQLRNSQRFDSGWSPTNINSPGLVINIFDRNIKVNYTSYIVFIYELYIYIYYLRFFIKFISMKSRKIDLELYKYLIIYFMCVYIYSSCSKTNRIVSSRSARWTWFFFTIFML